MNLHENPSAFRDVIRNAYQQTGIREDFLEKDYWICRSLQLLSRGDSEHHAIFKGGTSLTKAYGIGMRFSEDLDIAILNADTLSGNQLKNVIRRTSKSMSEGLTEVVHEGVTSKGSHYHKAFYAFPSVVDKPSRSVTKVGELLIEVNSFGNPYPWEMRPITPFLTEFLLQLNRADLVAQFDMDTFEVPVLDCRRTLTEKLVSLMRCSLADEYIAQLNAHIRHFYDLYYLLQDDSIRAYLSSPAFREDFASLLEHDRQQFAKPDGWQTRALSESPLLTNLHDTWEILVPTYSAELPELAYRPVPTADAIEENIKTILEYIV